MISTKLTPTPRRRKRPRIRVAKDASQDSPMRKNAPKNLRELLDRAYAISDPKKRLEALTAIHDSLMHVIRQDEANQE